MEIVFYCQKCDHAMDSSQFAELTDGKCPNCYSLEGFSTLSKKENDPFIGTTMINDSDLLNSTQDD
jgi:phage FluMu protein Com